MSTRTTTRRLLAVAASLTVAAGLAGCGGDDGVSPSPTGAVAFVGGARSNMPPPQVDGPVERVLLDALTNQSDVSVVVPDGMPSVGETLSLAITGSNGPAREQSKERNEQALESLVFGARAQDEESDLLGALDLAGRELSVVDTPPRTIVVVDSGLSTAGELNFLRPGLLDADPQEVVDSLSAAGALPELDGLKVVVQGLGDVQDPQERLGAAQRDNLVAIWRAVLDAAGADVEIVQKSLSREPLQEELPPVTPVPVRSAPVCVAGAVELTGGDVAFRPDSAEFVDRSAALAVLEPIAEQLAESGASATVTGTTAAVGPIEGQRTLSQERAQAVVDLLVELGVPAERLTAVGVGSEFAGYVQDHDPAGTLIPEAAAQNRKVVVEPQGGTAITCA